MTQNEWTSHCRRRFPYTRYATIEPPFQHWHRGPKIRLEGEWLKEAGFFPNWRIKITVQDRKLVIEPLIRPIGVLGRAPTFPKCMLPIGTSADFEKALRFG